MTRVDLGNIFGSSECKSPIDVIISDSSEITNKYLLPNTTDYSGNMYMTPGYVNPDQYGTADLKDLSGNVYRMSYESYLSEGSFNYINLQISFPFGSNISYMCVEGTYPPEWANAPETRDQFKEMASQLPQGRYIVDYGTTESRHWENIGVDESGQISYYASIKDNLYEQTNYTNFTTLFCGKPMPRRLYISDAENLKVYKENCFIPEYDGIHFLDWFLIDGQVKVLVTNFHGTMDPHFELYSDLVGKELEMVEEYSDISVSEGENRLVFISQQGTINQYVGSSMYPGGSASRLIGYVYGPFESEELAMDWVKRGNEVLWRNKTSDSEYYSTFLPKYNKFPEDGIVALQPGSITKYSLNTSGEVEGNEVIRLTSESERDVLVRAKSQDYLIFGSYTHSKEVTIPANSSYTISGIREYSIGGMPSGGNYSLRYNYDPIVVPRYDSTNNFQGLSFLCKKKTTMSIDIIIYNNTSSARTLTNVTYTLLIDGYYNWENFYTV